MKCVEQCSRVHTTFRAAAANLEYVFGFDWNICSICLQGTASRSGMGSESRQPKWLTSLLPCHCRANGRRTHPPKTIDSESPATALEPFYTAEYSGRAVGKRLGGSRLQLGRARCFNQQLQSGRTTSAAPVRQCGSGNRLPGIVVWEFRYARVRLAPTGSSPPDGTQHSVVCGLDRKQCACDGSSRGRQSCHTQGGVSYQTI